jgi:hypothetical protein
MVIILRTAMTTDKKTTIGDVFTYDIKELSKTDPNLIKYKEISKIKIFPSIHISFIKIPFRVWRILMVHLLLIFLFIFAFSVHRAEAFSFTINPITILERVANVIIVKISDTINYLIIQKKYLFDNFTDPNAYSSLKIPASIDKFLASTTPSVPVKKEAINISKPVVIVTPTIPDVKSILSFGSDSKILFFTNKERTAVSLAPLSANSVLDTVADQRADDLFTNQYFAHESPDNKSAVDLAEKIGYKYILSGF